MNENDVIFGLSNTRDEEGILTSLFHVDVDKMGIHFDFPISDRNLRYLRKLFSNLAIEEYDE
jgi:hypothetical protein